MSTLFAEALFLLKTWWKFALVLVSASVLSYQVGSCQGGSRQHKLDNAALDRANVVAQQAQHRADELAATQRITDTIAVSHQEQELRNAIATTPDTQPDPVRIRLGCERLHAAGTRSASLPSVCRSAGGTQASPAR